jgi:hypothetical protein
MPRIITILLLASFLAGCVMPSIQGAEIQATQIQAATASPEATPRPSETPLPTNTPTPEPTPTEIPLPEGLPNWATLVEGESGWVIEDEAGDVLYRFENGEWVEILQEATQFTQEMTKALDKGRQSFRIFDPNGMVITVDLPDNEENKASLVSGEATWSWELRGFTRINPKTGREQVMRFYYQEGEFKRERLSQREQWNDIADTIDVPGYGKITIEGDLATLASRSRLGRPAMRDFQFIKTDEALARWLAGLTY